MQIKTVVSGDYRLDTVDGRAVARTLAAWDAAGAEQLARRTLAVETLWSLAADLNDRGVPTPKDTRWNDTVLRQVLLRERNAEAAHLPRHGGYAGAMAADPERVGARLADGATARPQPTHHPRHRGALPDVGTAAVRQVRGAHAVAGRA